MTHEIEGPDFIWRRTLSSSEAVSLLVNKFPFVLELIDREDSDLAFHAYERFAAEVHKRISDAVLMKSVGLFIDELGDTADPLLKDILWDVFERIAEDRIVAMEFKQHIGPKARSMLEEVERDLYGREPQRKDP